MTIPACVHFCWIGKRLPWAYVFAVLSAAERGGMDEVVLHHTDELENGPELRALRQAPGVRLELTDPMVRLAQAQTRLGVGDGLTALYARLTSPVMRADVLRAAILYLEGGIYLDLDTITVASLRPLLGVSQFVGSEFIVWPHAVRSSRSPLVWAKHLTLDVLRKAMRLLPGGWRAFRRVEEWYFPGVNNAVMGAAPGAALFGAYLRAMLALPRERQTEPYALGPDLLQALISHYPAEELTIHPPQVFYPLAPEISEHWFRPSRSPRLEKVLPPDTRVVHWYASVRSKPYVARISPDYVREHKNSQLYSALVCFALHGLPGLT
ncbi:MAG: glycosyltransferase [Acidocella sp.]|nr:glycosyltransferase [Acidocella sp.]